MQEDAPSFIRSNDHAGDYSVHAVTETVRGGKIEREMHVGRARGTSNFSDWKVTFFSMIVQQDLLPSILPSYGGGEKFLVIGRMVSGEGNFKLFFFRKNV